MPSQEAHLLESVPSCSPSHILSGLNQVPDDGQQAQGSRIREWWCFRSVLWEGVPLRTQLSCFKEALTSQWEEEIASRMRQLKKRNRGAQLNSQLKKPPEENYMAQKNPPPTHRILRNQGCFQPLNVGVLYIQFSSVQFSRSVVSDSLRPRESQHARPPCPSPAPRVYSNSCPSSR